MLTFISIIILCIIIKGFRCIFKKREPVFLAYAGYRVTTVYSANKHVNKYFILLGLLSR